MEGGWDAFRSSISNTFPKCCIGLRLGRKGSLSRVWEYHDCLAGIFIIIMTVQLLFLVVSWAVDVLHAVGPLGPLAGPNWRCSSAPTGSSRGRNPGRRNLGQPRLDARRPPGPRRISTVTASPNDTQPPCSHHHQNPVHDLAFCIQYSDPYLTSQLLASFFYSSNPLPFPLLRIFLLPLLPSSGSPNLVSISITERT